jgi:hypothetical protein
VNANRVVIRWIFHFESHRQNWIAETERSNSQIPWSRPRFSCIRPVTKKSGVC